MNIAGGKLAAKPSGCSSSRVGKRFGLLRIVWSGRSKWGFEFPNFDVSPVGVVMTLRCGDVGACDEHPTSKTGAGRF